MIAFIDDHRGAYGVEPICRVLPIAPSTYHAHAARRADPARLPARARRDLVLAADIRRVFDANFGVYGVRKVWRQLGREGIEVARCTVARLMRQMGLQGVVRGREVRTTVSNPAVACPLDRVNRQFHAPRPNALWLSDFTYVATWQGFVYVAFVIDAYRPAHRRLAGEPDSPSGLRAGCAGAGSAERRPVQGGGLVHHSDRGVQYVSIRYTERLAEAGIEPSVGSVGDSYDNALAESINGLYKTEVIRSTGTVALARSRRVRHPGMGRVVQQPPPARANRQHASRRGRSALLCPDLRPPPWRRDSKKPASGKPGAVHSRPC